MPHIPQPISPRELVERYDALLLDAFGVLVDAGGPLELGRKLLAELERAGRPFRVVTNDASRLPETAAARFRRLGLAIAPDQVFSSGSLLASHFAAHGLVGSRCRVHGPADSREFVRRAGGELLDPASDELPDTLVVCDERGDDLLATLDRSVTLLYRALDAGRLPHLVLANSDLVFPHGPRAWGFTAGAIALLLEAALARRFPRGEPPRFLRLGKPGPELLEQALATLGSPPAAAMVGDQLDTDIAAAHAAGLDSALVASLPAGTRPPLPTWLLATL